MCPLYRTSNKVSMHSSATPGDSEFKGIYRRADAVSEAHAAGAGATRPCTQAAYPPCL